MVINQSYFGTQIYLQPIIVTGSGPSTREVSPNMPVGNPTLAPQSQYQITDISYGNPILTTVMSPSYPRMVLEPIFSTVPRISSSELLGNYVELADALNDLSEYSFEDTDKLEPAVSINSGYVAAQLFHLGFPAPRIFTHGPKSVVFNWSDGINNLYLTISSEKISALISTPEQIKARVSFSPSKFFESPEILSQLNSAYRQTPVRIGSRASSGTLLDS